jgi:hypothetical protein
MYMRLVGRPVDVYQYLEPLYNDYRKLRRRTTLGARRAGGGVIVVYVCVCVCVCVFVCVCVCVCV